MKIGDVLKKERTGKGLSRVVPMSVSEVADVLGITPAEYEKLEAGDPELERWFPILCRIAVAVEAPVSHLICETGRWSGAADGKVGTRIRDHREEHGSTVEAMAEALSCAIADYVAIEKCQSPLEKLGPLMQRLAEKLDQPVFNLFMPCGVLYSELDDYP